MDPEDRNRRAAVRWFQEVWNGWDESAIYELTHPDAIIHGIAGAQAPAWGVEQFVEFHRQMRAAIPDLCFQMTHLMAEGEWTSSRLEAFGTHTGPLDGMPATGRTFRFSLQAIIRWEDGLQIESWNEWDQYGLLRQLGWVR